MPARARAVLEVLMKGRDAVSRPAKQAAGALEGLKGAVAGLGLAYAGTRLANMALDLAKVGAQASLTESSFRSMTASAGVSADILDDMRDAAAGTIPDLELMAALNTSLIGVTKEFGQEIANAYPQLIQIARAASIANPALGNTAFMIQSLSTGLKRNSKLLIDNTGLMIDQAEGQTLLNATLEAGARLVDQVGVSNENLAIQMMQVEVALDNLKVAWGKWLTDMVEAEDGLGGLALTAIDFLSGWAEWETALNRMSRTFNRLAEDGHLTEQQMEALGDRISALGTKVTFLQMRGQDAVKMMEDMAAEMGINIRAYDEFYKVAGRGTDGLYAFEEALDHAVPATELAALAADRAAEATTRYEKAVQMAKGALSGFLGLLDEVGKSTLDVAALTERFGVSMTRYVGQVPQEMAERATALYDEIVSANAEALQLMEEPARQWHLRSVELWAEQEAGITSWLDSMRQAGPAAAAAMDPLLSVIGGMMQPTMPGDWWNTLLPREDEWDEWARRAADVANLGPGSPWFDQLMETFPSFRDLIERSEDPRVAAAQWVDMFYKGLVPEDAAIQHIVDRYADMMATEASQAGFVQRIADAIRGRGLEVKMPVVEALVGGGPKRTAFELPEVLKIPDALIESAGTDTGTKIADKQYEGWAFTMGHKRWDEDLTGAWYLNLAAHEGEYQEAGRQTGDVLVEGMLTAFEGADFKGVIVKALGDTMAQWLDREARHAWD